MTAGFSLKSAVVGAAVALAATALADEAAASTVYRISQESAPGAGDFDSNVLGTIEAYDYGTVTAPEFYSYNSPVDVSYNGDVQVFQNTTTMFLVETSEGLSLTYVHDRRGDTTDTGGRARTEIEVVGDTVDFLVVDDRGLAPSANDSYSNIGGTTLVAEQTWGGGNTDGAVIGTLDGDAWTLFIQFTEEPVAGAPINPQGLISWQVFGPDGTVIDLELVPGQRVRIDVVPLPAAAWLLGSALVGLVVVGRRVSDAKKGM